LIIIADLRFIVKRKNTQKSYTPKGVVPVVKKANKFFIMK